MASLFSGRAGRLAAMANYEANQRARDSALDAIKRGQDEAMPFLQQSVDAYNPLIETGGNAYQNYMDATGVGDSQAGVDRFKASPLYRLAYDEGLSAIDNSAAARGGMFSGATLKALQDRGQKTAGNLFGQYLQGFNPLLNSYGTGVAGRSQGLARMAQVPLETARANAGIQSTFGPKLGDIAAGGLMAGQNAQANSWNLGMNAANTLASFAGRFMGGAK